MTVNPPTHKSSHPRIAVIGGGLAGSEAAWQIAQAGEDVDLFEMRPKLMTPAHQSHSLAELVCSNTFKSKDPLSAPGMLKEELHKLDSFILNQAERATIPADKALAVDRVIFAANVTQALDSHPRVRVIREEVKSIRPLLGDYELILLATGPLTSPDLTQDLKDFLQLKDKLHFYDAIAPIVSFESLDTSAMYRLNRYQPDGSIEGDYLNIPLDKEGYNFFIDQVNQAEKVEPKDFEDSQYFEACLPIEVMIERGRDTLRFGPLKPVGLENPTTGKRPWAVIQLRKEDQDGQMWSFVGFQTRMKWPEQKRVLSMLPGMQNAEFLRFGSIHRNTYIESPLYLQPDLSFRSCPNLFLAGQITGVEGYTESTAIGLLAARSMRARLSKTAWHLPPKTSMIGALGHYVCFGNLGKFAPMNTNMGLLPAIESPEGQKKLSKPQRKQILTERGRKDFLLYLESLE